MASTHDTTLLFHNTMRITPGRLDEFREAIRRAVEFTERHAPQLMVQVFLDEERMLAHSFQLYRDSASVLTHWQLSDPYIRDVMKHCSVRAFEVYGEPDQEVADGLTSSEFDAPVVFLPRLGGFTRPLGEPLPGQEPVTGG
ncbi:hypothetical protein KIK06_13230 [Nocardiopsis sp. EMB25]|uniref:hypothetical protein n=1 Tax=Nocardiopsis sp. EMB25 TaxID=2835867 RepID=UPI00228413AE|nr:hypothetical protein [Nocardiopsis sp. EMB25]MCY9784853.1 hypothetical protein [Nocardiopsis sp. EMB25]